MFRRLSSRSVGGDEEPYEEIPLDFYYQPVQIGRSIQSASRGIVQPHGTVLSFPATQMTRTSSQVGVGVGFAKSARGVFVNSIRSRSMGAESEDVVLGMLVEEVNGQTTEHMTTGKIDALVNRGAEVTLKLRYDPQLYATIDGGRELRRIQGIVFQGDSPDLERSVAQVRYLGTATVSAASEFQAMRACEINGANKRESSLSKRGTGEGKLPWIPLSISNYCLVVHRQDPMLSLPLIDVQVCTCKGAFISAIVVTKTFEAGLSKTEMIAYTFMCKTKQLAADLISKIQTKREHGQLRIRQAVRRSMGMARRGSIVAQSLVDAQGEKLDPANAAKSGGGSPAADSPPGSDDTTAESVERPVNKADIGERCKIKGYDCEGVIRFFGADAGTGKPKVGVELDEPIGKNDGLVRNHRYFNCDKKRGLLVVPKKVTVLSDERLDSSEAFAGFVDDVEPVAMRPKKGAKSSSRPSSGNFGGYDDGSDGRSKQMKRNSGGGGSGDEFDNGFGGADGSRRLSFNRGGSGSPESPGGGGGGGGAAPKGSPGDDEFNEDFDDDFSDDDLDDESDDDDDRGRTSPGGTAKTPSPSGDAKTPDSLDSEHVYNCVYHGSTVHSNNDTELANVAAFCYFDVVEDPANEKTNAKCTVSRESIALSERRGDDTLQSHSVLELLYHEDLGDGFFVYITSPRFGTLRRQGRVKFCHVVSFKGKVLTRAKATFDAFAAWAAGENELEEQRTKASTSQSALLMARKRSVTTIDSLATDVANADIEEEQVEAFRARLLGRVVLPPGAKGMAVAQQSVASLGLKKRIRPINVAIVVEADGLRIIDELSQDMIMSILTTQLQFASPISDPSVIKCLKGKFKNWNQHMVVLMHVDASGRSTCDVYSSGSKTTDISEAIKAAYAAVAKKRANMNDDPFAAVSQGITEVTGAIGNIQISRDKLTPLKPIGQGQFGFVYMAHQQMLSGDRETRACKLLKPNAQIEDRTLFVKEIEVMMAFDHVNVVRLVGVCISQRPWIAVLEYMQYNDLRKFLRFAKDKKIIFTPLEVLHMAAQAAAGMQHIAERRYVHMDLAARNLLLTDNSVVKVADFGSAVQLLEGKKQYKLDHKLMVSVKWAAYESMTRKRFSEKSDVWSWGVTCWELFEYGATPYKGIKPTQIMTKITVDKIRLPKPAGCSDEWYDNMLMSCWFEEPKSRPTFKKLIAQLKSYMASIAGDHPAVRDLGVVARSAKQVQTIAVDDDDDDADV